MSNILSTPLGIYVGHGISLDGSKDSGCVYGKYTEAGLMIPITKSCVSYLKKCGFTKIVTDAPDNRINMVKQVEKSNSEKVKLHVAFHCDYSKAPKGTMPLYISESGKKLATAMNKWVCKYSGLTTRGVAKRTDLYELNETAMPAVIFECGSIKEDLTLLRTKFDEIGKGAAHGICDYLGATWYEDKKVKTVTPKEKKETVKAPLATKGEKLCASMEKVCDKILKHKLKYDGTATYTTLNKSVKNGKKVNCALAVTWALQDLKVLPTNRRIWLGNDVNSSGATTLKKRATVTHPNKLPKHIKFKKGDIVGFQWGDSKKNKVHTMIFDRYDKKGHPIWWTVGGYDVKVKKLCHRRKKYEGKEVKTLVRLKEK